MRARGRTFFSPNALRKFADVRFLLYSSHEIGTYPGDAKTFPDSKPDLASPPSAQDSDVGAHWVSRRVGRHGGTGLDADPAAPPRAQTACPDQPVASGADVSCDAGRRHVGRALFRVVPGAPRQQFV